MKRRERVQILELGICHCAHLYCQRKSMMMTMIVMMMINVMLTVVLMVMIYWDKWDLSRGLALVVAQLFIKIECRHSLNPAVMMKTMMVMMMKMTITVKIMMMVITKAAMMKVIGDDDNNDDDVCCNFPSRLL